MKVWGFYKGSGRLPHRAEVRGALTRVGYRNIRARPGRRRRCGFDRPGVEIDPGGIGKGYAVDRMVDILKQNGITAALISAGPAAVFMASARRRRSRRGWRIEIMNPKDTSKTGDGSVSERYVDVDFRQLREILPGGGTDVQPHHGPAHGISGAGHAVGFGDRAANARQRGVDQAVFHQWPPLGGQA